MKLLLVQKHNITLEIRSVRSLVFLSYLYKVHGDSDYSNGTLYSVSHMSTVTHRSVPRMHLATSKQADVRDSCFLCMLPGLAEKKKGGGGALVVGGSWGTELGNGVNLCFC